MIGMSERTVAFCAYCNRDVELVLSPSGPHIRGDCSVCGRYVKFVEQSETMPVGKYKGIRFSEIPRAYLQWFVGNGGVERFSGARKRALFAVLSMEEEDERIDEGPDAA